MCTFVCVFMYMYMCICMYVCVYIYAYICVYACMCVRIKKLVRGEIEESVRNKEGNSTKRSGE